MEHIPEWFAEQIQDQLMDSYNIENDFVTEYCLLDEGEDEDDTTTTTDDIDNIKIKTASLQNFENFLSEIEQFLSNPIEIKMACTGIVRYTYISGSSKGIQDKKRFYFDCYAEVNFKEKEVNIISIEDVEF